MTLKVIGAGFGRTGTRSLKAALEELGFDRCYHMEEVLKNPHHLKCWAAIMEGGAADWETLFQDYQSATDWPAAAYYHQLMTAYPEAKIILTVRDPDRWHQSLMNTIYQASRKFARFTRIIPPVHQFLNAMEKAVWQGIFHNKVEDREYAVGIFQNHIEEVKRIVPGERLLIFEARQGWQPLCAFLGVPVPSDKPYPHRNNGARVRWILRYKLIIKWGMAVLLIALLIWLLGTLVIR